jgi:hypothetical protein
MRITVLRYRLLNLSGIAKAKTSDEIDIVVQTTQSAMDRDEETDAKNEESDDYSDVESE